MHMREETKENPGTSLSHFLRSQLSTLSPFPNDPRIQAYNSVWGSNPRDMHETRIFTGLAIVNDGWLLTGTIAAGDGVAYHFKW
jgi:hypothetical protein